MEQYSPFSSSPSQETTSSWWQGFTQILTAPYHFGQSYSRPIIHPIMIAFLLNIFVSVFTSYLITAQPQVLAEIFYQTKQAFMPLKATLPEEKLEELIDQTWNNLATFSLTRSIFAGISSAAFGIFLPAAVFWIFYRITIADMPNYLLVANFMSFAQMIIFIGGIVNGITQYVGGSLRYSTSLLLFTSDITQLPPTTFAVFQQIELFNIWAFVAASLALAGRVNAPKIQGIIYALLLYGLKLLIITLPIWLASLTSRIA